MAVLVFLADAGGAVVARNTILDSVWPRMAVSPDALTQCIVELRKALGDSARHPMYIETIPKRGVRLIAPVAIEESPTAGTSFFNRDRYLVKALGAAGIISIALIGWFRISNRSDEIVVPSPLASIGREGSSGLQDIITDDPLAMDAYMTGNELSTNGKNPLDSLPLAVEAYSVATTHDPTFVMAWVRLGSAHARMYWYGVDRTPARLTMAEQAIRRALDLQPASFEAHLALGDLYYRRGEYRAALTQFKIVEPAMTEDAGVYFLLASVQRRLGDWDESVQNFVRAVSLDPRNVAYLRQLHTTHLFRRDYAQAAAILDRILAIAPDNPTAHVDGIVLALCRDGNVAIASQYANGSPTAGYETGLAYVYTTWLAAVFARNYERALAVLDGTSEDWILDGDLRTSSTPKTLLYARTYELIGDADKAQAMFTSVKALMEARLAEGNDDDIPATAALLIHLAETQAALGETESAWRSMQTARELLPKSRDQLVGSALQLAAAVRVLPRIPNHESLARELEDYLAGPGLWSLEGILADPRLDAIRTDPQIQQLLSRREPIIEKINDD